MAEFSAMQAAGGGGGEQGACVPRNIQVSLSTTPRTYYTLGKRFLVTDASITFSALEAASVVAVDAAEQLQRNRIAKITRVETGYPLVTMRGTSREVARARIQITMLRTPEYERWLEDNREDEGGEDRGEGKVDAGGDA